MARVNDKVQFALNEVRILILGAEILLGFQFHAVFQPQFGSLPLVSRYLDGVAYALMLIAVMLLVAPGSFHRLVEDGNDTARLHRVTTTFATAALAPFALCLGVDEIMVAGKVLGTGLAVDLGCLVALLAFIAWYGVELVRRRPRLEPEMEEVMETPIKEKIKTMGTEIRVILPGAQALLGFQFAAFLTTAFDKLPGTVQAIHFASLIAMAIAVILLTAPAAYHRIAADGEDTGDVETFGSHAMLAALAFLGLSMTGDFYVVVTMVTSSQPLAIGGAIVAVIAAFALWFLYPFLIRRRSGVLG